MEMTYDTFLESLCHQTGIESAPEAEQLASAVLCVLGEVLVDSDRDALAAELPAPLREPLCSRTPEQDLDLDAFYTRLSGAENLDEGRARESAQVVGRTLARAIDAELTRRLRRRLPPDYEELFVDPHRVLDAQPHRDPAALANQRTIAEGKSGSEEPVSEGKPPEGQRDSVATDAEPHRDTQLATGRESSEVDEQTLAGGKPGSDRPLSDTHDD